MSGLTYRGWQIEAPNGLQRHWGAMSPDFAGLLDDEHDGHRAFGDTRADLEAEIDEIMEARQ